MAGVNVVESVKSAIRPNYLISLLVALVVLALINGFLPAEYKISKLIGGLFT